MSIETPAAGGPDGSPTPRFRCSMRSLAILLAAVLIASSVCVATLVSYGWYLRRAWTGAFVRTLGSTDTSAYNLPEVAEEDNAAFRFMRAGGAIAFEPADSLLLSEVRHRPGVLAAPETQRAVEAILRQHRTPIFHARQAAGLGGSSFGVDYTNLFNRPRLGAVMQLFNLLAARGYLALQRGDAVRAVDTIRVLGRLAEVLESEPDEFFIMLGLGVEQEQLRILRALLALPGTDREACRSAGAALARTDLAGSYRRYLGFGGASQVRLRSWALGLEPDDRGSSEPVGWLARFVPDYITAIGLRECVRCAEAYPLDYARLLRHVETGSPLPGPILRRLRKAAVIRCARIARPLKTVLALRQIAVVALAIRCGDPEEKAATGAACASDAGPTNAFTGTAVETTWRPDGGIVITIPDALEVWESTAEVHETTAPPPFTWSLPPAAPGRTRAWYTAPGATSG